MINRQSLLSDLQSLLKRLEADLLERSEDLTQRRKGAKEEWQIAPVHKKQLLTYLRLTECHLGLLINFNTELIKDGISRVVNNLPDTFAP